MLLGGVSELGVPELICTSLGQTGVPELELEELPPRCIYSGHDMPEELEIRMLGIGGSKLELDEKSWFMGSSFGSLELELDTPELMLTSLGQTGAPELPLGAPELP
ncbi:MAG: hypothetical protein J6A21_05760, partial [Lentisphaeria bacterium]|nr:hypothetical protein [Lentisphaeria bacterium]